MAKLIILVGPPGSGKSTMANSLEASDYLRISQDVMGKEGHWDAFMRGIDSGRDVVVDRLNFQKGQRDRYISHGITFGYSTEMIVLHENYDTCLARCLARKDHETIRDQRSAKEALNMFFSRYERVYDSEADKVLRLWPEAEKEVTVIIDLDGTLCNVSHRLRHVRGEDKKNWKGFFESMRDDTPNAWCADLVYKLQDSFTVVFCSGRPDNYKKDTVDWLERYGFPTDKLYMRRRSDSRKDHITKEVILEFELLTRYRPHFFIDDRQSVVDLWRRHGFVALQCDEGNF